MNSLRKIKKRYVKVKNKNDANTVVEELYKQNYFDLVRRMFYSYRVHILRITKMKVSIFKMSDDTMDDVGGQSSEDESSNDESEEEFDEQSDLEKNDFVLLEAEDDDNLDEYESDFDVEENIEKSNFRDSETEKDLTKIRSFLKTGSRTNKIFKGLKRELQRNVGGVVNDNKCFFRRIAVASLLAEKEIRVEDLVVRKNEKAHLKTLIENKTAELFRMYAEVYKLTPEQILTFQGVSVKIMPAMEFLFKCKIMEFIPKVSKGQVKMALLSKSSNRLNFQKKMNVNLILFNNHYYLVMKKRLLMDNISCLVCGQNFVWMKSLLTHRAGSGKKITRCNTDVTLISATGVVDVHELLPEMLKKMFHLPNEILEDVVKDDNDDIENIENRDDMYFKRNMACYDFESLLNKTSLSELKSRRLKNIRDGQFGESEENERLKKEAEDNFFN